MDMLRDALQRLGIAAEDATLRMLQAKTTLQPVLLRRDVARDRVAYFTEHRMDFPGLFLDVEPLCSYPYGALAAHLLGYLGQISETQMQRSEPGIYQPDTLIGQYGLERRYEAVLRGTYGIRQVEVDTFGRETQQLAVQPPIPGINLVLTLNLALQEAAERLLDAHTGSIVALDPRNGQILALASRLAFDPNRFASHLSAQEWTRLAVLQGQYSPGSIFKIITALGVLGEGMATPRTTVCCTGKHVYGRRTYHDWKRTGHGCVTVYEALVQSCDVFFYQMGQALGIDRLAHYSRAFGLGQSTGFAPETEQPGLVPSTQWKRQNRGEPWYGGETLSVAIGQGYTLTTPLQVATVIATVANGGALYQPYVVLR